MIEERTAWQAFASRDRQHDGRFVVGVTSTRIYCRPSCPARRPRREHVLFFATPEEARSAGLRACRRCLPDQVAPDRAAVERARRLLEEAGGPLPLETLAQATSYSPSYLQRIFTRALGLSPAAYGRSLRLAAAGDRLRGGASVTEAIYEAGYSAPSRFYADAGQWGMLPSDLKRKGEGIEIAYSTGDSPFGKVLVGASSRGICFLGFGQDPDALRRRFPAARLVHAPDHHLIRAALEAVARPGLPHDLPVDLAGTAFQQRVWAELRRIPPGETRSYLDIARALGDPKATRAVGTANGANPVAVLVPCHRVVRNDGSLGGYAGGLERKKALLAAESKATQGELPLSR
jgi:AraC family transcriptional regulator, regulatory protein of adaptative response / methylated-DNA-[protein]-cysteine methyltransferase